MFIAALIGITISIIVGITLIPAITSTLKKEIVDEGDSIPESLNVLIDILPVVFIVVVLVGAVAWIGGSWGGESSDTTRSRLSAWREDRRQKNHWRDSLAHEEEHGELHSEGESIQDLSRDMEQEIIRSMMDVKEPEEPEEPEETGSSWRKRGSKS